MHVCRHTNTDGDALNHGCEVGPLPHLTIRSSAKGQECHRKGMFTLELGVRELMGYG